MEHKGIVDYNEVSPFERLIFDLKKGDYADVIVQDSKIEPNQMMSRILNWQRRGKLPADIMYSRKMIGEKVVRIFAF